MNIFTNENIIKLTFTNYNLKENVTILHKTYNTTLILLNLRTINYESMFTSKRKHKLLTKTNYEASHLVALDNNNIIVISTQAIRFWDMNSYQCIWTIKIDDNIVSSTKLPTGQLVTFTYSGQIQFWDSDYKTIKNTIPLRGCKGQRKQLFNIADGTLLACYVFYDDEDTIMIIDCQTIKVIKILNNELGFIYSIVNLSNNRFASCSGNGYITIWEMKDYKCITSYYAEDDKSAVNALLFVEKKNLLISASKISFKFWDMNQGLPLYVHRIDGVVAYQFLSISNSYFASVGGVGGIKIWCLNTFQCINELTGSPYILSALMLKDYRIISSAFMGILIWDY
jgi:WD40 repeat protein